MPVHSTTRPRQRPLRRHLHVERLETRALPSGTGLPQLLNPALETETNDTLDLALDLGSLNGSGLAEAVGTIGNSAAGPADVDWYSFTLTRAASVTLTSFNPQGDGSLATVLTLYNNAVDVFDPFVPTGHRVVAQADGAANNGITSIDQLLAPGTYFVAVSGSGNSLFYPFLENSGTEGITGDYGFVVTAIDGPVQPGDGPHVLSAGPGDGAVLDRSPFELRLSLSSSLDPNSIAPGVNVFLTWSPNGTFGDGNDQDIPLTATFSTSANELQLMPIAPSTFAQQPLDRGYYRLFLDAGTITDPAGIWLGTDAAHPLGNDFVLTFQINGIEGRTGSGATADDTPATAHDLGDVTSTGLVQVAGAIGDDPAYNPANSSSFLSNPAADVDLYRFQITGPGNHALVAQVSAGSIGYWQLDPAISLFRVNAVDGRLELVAANDNTLNDTLATDGMTPFYNDAVLFAGLPPGEYYLAVSGASNLPDPLQGIDPGTNGVFDPNIPHSGQNGFTTGDYVLNLLVHPDDVAPQVGTVTLTEGALLDAAPTQFSVQFDEPMNLQQLAHNQLQLTSQGDLASVFIRGSDGVDYYPRLLSYDSATNQTVFLMLNRLPNGDNELHLSGALGLTDIAGNPLAGNDPGDPAADYVVRFTVNGIAPGTAGNPLLWMDQEPNETLAQAQVLGAIFPLEFQAGITVRRNFTGAPASAPADRADFYQFEVLQDRGYFFRLTGTGLPAGTRPQIFTEAGILVPTTGGAVRLANLDPGIYYVRVGGWTVAQAPNVRYDLRITLGGSVESPTPLTAGPVPAYRIRFPNGGLPPGWGSSTGGGSTGDGNTGGGSTGGGSTGDGNTGGGSTGDGNTGGGSSGGSGTTTPPPTPVGPPQVVLPPTGDATGVVPAVITPITGNSLSLTGVPANALVQLSVAPLGGTRHPGSGEGTPPADRLVLPGTEGTGGNGSIRLALQDRYGPDYPADQPNSTAELEAILSETDILPEQLRQQILDGLFGRQDSGELMEYWVPMFWGPLTIPESSPEPGTTEEEEPAGDELELELEALSLGWDDTSTAPDADLAWATGLLAACAIGLIGLEKQRLADAVVASPRGSRFNR